MSRLRVDTGAGLDGGLAVLADRSVVPFATTAERDQQWPAPPPGAMCFVEATATWYGWTGTAWTAFGAAAGGAGSFVRIVRAALTDKTTWSGIGWEQWGTETCDLAHTLLPTLTGVTVEAILVGSVLNMTNTNSLAAGVEISLDGGGTWLGTGFANVLRVNPAENALGRYPISAQYATTGTVTGTIKARGMGQQAVGAADPRDLTAGYLHMTVEAH